MTPLLPGMVPQVQDIWNFYNEQVSRGMIQPQVNPQSINWAAVNPTVQRLLIGGLTNGAVTPETLPRYLDASVGMNNPGTTPPMTMPNTQPIPPMTDPQSGLPQYLDDFVEGNWDVAYNALMPSGGAFSFTNWLRGQSNRYESQYLGQLGQEALVGRTPTTTSQGFLRSLFPMAAHDYLSTSPFARGEQVNRAVPNRWRF